ncbi:MAG: S-layer homology domain-containing protein [Firmicutes bacterium]|jgi:hypothetical protein|nr:S-layer homology domain-containing protein [Bacillota bacterium]
MIRRMKLLALTALAMIVIASPRAAGAPSLVDIDGHWAEGAIKSLVNMGVVEGYPDKTYRPESPVTRAEFAKIVSRAFGFAPSMDTGFRDMDGHWAEPFVSALDSAKVVTGYPDGTFQPSRNISRAEMVTMLARVAQLGEIGAADAATWVPSFRDVGVDHWAFRYVEIARRLDIIPLHFGLVFQPEQATTRAETAYMVKTLSDAQFARGTVTQISSTTQAVTIKNAAGDTQVIQVDPDTVIYRNGTATTLGSIKKNDTVFVVGTSYGIPRFVMAEGLVTKEDITRKVSSLTGGVLTPDQIDLISRGKWEEAREGMSPALVSRLTEMGLTTEEAQAILDQNWNRLPELGRERLSMALGDELGVAPELIAAVMDRDWESAKTYAQLEAAQILLSRLLKL